MHTGEKVALTLRPAAPDTGIVFRRIDLAAPVEIKATESAAEFLLFDLPRPQQRPN